MWIVDSSVWIDYFNGTPSPQSDLLHAALGKRQIGLTDIILLEVLQGYRYNKDFEAAKAALMQFSIYPASSVNMAVKSAQNYRFLRRKGVTVRKTIDCLIATLVIEFDFWLLHNDRAFDPFETYLGLKVVR